MTQYDIGPGNNHPMTIKVFSRRPWWGDHKSTMKSPSFYWRSRIDLQFSMFSDEGSRKVFNRFERFIELHQKDNLFRNLWFLCNVVYRYCRGQAMIFSATCL